MAEATKEEILKSNLLDKIKDAETMLSLLEQNYQSLDRARRQLPIRFLTKTGISEHIKRVSKSNLAYIQKLKKQNQEKEKELLETQEKYKKASNPDEKKKIKEKGQNLQKEVKNIKEILNKEDSISLELKDERVKYFYEDLLLFVANCKHEAIDLWKYAFGTFEEIKNESEYFEAKYLLDVSEDYLRRKGFSKISLDIRESFIKSQDELKKINQLVGKLKSLRDSSKKLVDGFEADEVNFRRFADRKNSGL